MIRWLSFGAGFLFALGSGAPAWADLKPGEEEREGKPAEEAAPHHADNPLPAIIELMRKAEERLVEADTTFRTQEEQERIVRALETQEAARKALDDLIREVESHGGGT